MLISRISRRLWLIKRSLKVDYNFSIYPGASWMEFFKIATTQKKMSLDQAKEFCKEFACNEAKQAIDKLKS